MPVGLSGQRARATCQGNVLVHGLAAGGLSSPLGNWRPRQTARTKAGCCWAVGPKPANETRMGWVKAHRSAALATARAGPLQALRTSRLMQW